MKHKSKAATHLSELKVLHNNQWGQGLNCLRSENGTEFVNINDYRDLYKERHHTSAHRAVQSTAERDSGKNESHDHGEGSKHAPLQSK